MEHRRNIINLLNFTFFYFSLVGDELAEMLYTLYILPLKKYSEVFIYRRKLYSGYFHEQTQKIGRLDGKCQCGIMGFRHSRSVLDLEHSPRTFHENSIILVDGDVQPQFASSDSKRSGYMRFSSPSLPITNGMAPKDDQKI